MKLKLVKATNKYRNQIVDMLDEWNNSGEELFICNWSFRLQ